MSDIQDAGILPWQPACEIRGNFAIGHLRDNLLRWLQGPKGVHVETLACVAGALSGFAAQHAALLDAATITSEHGKVTAPAMLLISSGEEKLVLGDLVNGYLLEGPYTLYSFATAKALEAGMKRDELPDVREIVRYVIASLGSPSFANIRVPEQHKPGLTVRDASRLFWPGLVQVMQLPLPGIISPAEPPLDPRYWTAIAGIASGLLLVRAKDVLDPKLFYTIMMEAAVFASKSDPEQTVPGEWRFEVRPGGIAVYHHPGQI